VDDDSETADSFSRSVLKILRFHSLSHQPLACSPEIFSRGGRGINLQWVEQPVLTLGFFRSIGSYRHRDSAFQSLDPNLRELVCFLTTG
jgi:hypothetical protein